jgi:hypothetical protein
MWDAKMEDTIEDAHGLEPQENREGRKIANC